MTVKLTADEAAREQSSMGGPGRRAAAGRAAAYLQGVNPIQENVMRPLRYSINITLDGCCDHRVIVPDEEMHRHAAETRAQADALLFGRVICEMMEAAWRPFAETGTRPDWMEPWMEPFAWAESA